MNNKLTKKEKNYILNCCLDEIDVARENKKEFKKRGLDVSKFNGWIKKQKEIIKNLQAGIA